MVKLKEYDPRFIQELRDKAQRVIDTNSSEVIKSEAMRFLKETDNVAKAKGERLT